MQPSARWEPLPSNLPTTIAAERASSIFTKGLSRQLIERGIRVNAVAPGPFWTPMQPSGGQTPEKVVELGKSVPIGRPGQPVELAPIYVFLASQEAIYVTGEIYGLTGRHRYRVIRLQRGLRASACSAADARQ